jgi:hypothetical protein
MSQYKIIGIIILTLALVAGIFYTGVRYGENLDAEEENGQLQATITELQEQQRINGEITKENDELFSQLQVKLNERPPKVEVQPYVTNKQKNAQCNPTLGMLSVLNEAAGYPIGTFENPKLTVDQSRAASTVTYEAIMQYSGEAIRKYENLRLQHGALCDAITNIQNKKPPY